MSKRPLIISASVLAALAVILGAFLLGRNSNDKADTTTATTSITTTSITVQTTTTAKATTTTASSTSTKKPAKNAEDAANGLFAARNAGSKADAAVYGAPAAVTSIFQLTPPLGWTFEGCDGAAGTFHCSWYYEGGAATMVVRPNQETGVFTVDEITYTAD